MRPTSEKELAAVLLLDGPSRFKHFVKRVVDSQAAWGLWKDGWLMMGDPDERFVFPLWPAREYAELHRIEQWKESEAREIPLDDILNELLPTLSERSALPGVFPIPLGKGTTLLPKELEAYLRQEMARYE